LSGYYGKPKFVLEGRAAGLTGPTIYRAFMDMYLARHIGCMGPFCASCETTIARGQRLILSCLEAVAEAEWPGP
jgi:hypothetical protein